MNPKNRSRRQFLHTAGGLAIGSLASHAASTDGGNRIRIGQFGTRHAHASGKLDAIRSLPDLFDVIGVVEPDDARWEEVRQRAPYAGCKRLTEAELLNDTSVQAVAVETDVVDLVPTAMRCLDAGKHLHLDKPAGESLEACRAMHALATEKHLTIQMGYMLRYNPAFQFLYEVLEEGWLGEITEVSGMMGKFMNDEGRAQLSIYEGGGMFELACHLIDQVVTVLGKPDKVTPFIRRTRPEQDNFADNQLAVFEYSTALATVRCNHIDRMGGPRREFRVSGVDGTLEIRPLESGQVRLGLSRDCGPYKKGFQDLTFRREGGRYDAEFIDLAKVIRGEKKLAWDGAHDIATHQAVLEACGLI